MENSKKSIVSGNLFDKVYSGKNYLIKDKKQNKMTDEHIEEVLELYHKREEVEKQSYLASFEEIEENDFNLNIPRYVDTFEKEPDVDINAVLTDMNNIDDELEKVQGELVAQMKELTAEDDTIMASLNSLIEMMGR